MVNEITTRLNLQGFRGSVAHALCARAGAKFAAFRKIDSVNPGQTMRGVIIDGRVYGRDTAKWQRQDVKASHTIGYSQFRNLSE
jgi:hypothetical protein